MNLSISDQKKYLSEIWEVVPLYNMEKADIEKYQNMAKKFGSPNVNLKDYISAPDNDSTNRNAWTDIENHLTTPYLVIDKYTKEIVFYFALCCGMVYSDRQDNPAYSDAEVSFLNTFRQALIARDKTAIKQLKELSKTFGYEKDIQTLQTLYNENKAEQLVMRETDLSQIVTATYPAIELTHFCKNSLYFCKPRKIQIKTGSYIFWEFVVPKVITFSKQMSAKYLYLFAASEDYSVISRSSKLTNYYQQHLKFSPLSPLDNRKLIKPHYDFSCNCMMQEISLLKKHKKEYYAELDEK